MRKQVAGALAATAAVLLSGCQSYPPAPATAAPAMANASTPDPQRVRTVQDFMNDNPALSAVDMRPLSADRRMFVFESAPQIVTTSLPSYTPPRAPIQQRDLGRCFQQRECHHRRSASRLALNATCLPCFPDCEAHRNRLDAF